MNHAIVISHQKGATCCVGIWKSSVQVYCFPLTRNLQKSSQPVLPEENVKYSIFKGSCARPPATLKLVKMH